MSEKLNRTNDAPENLRDTERISEHQEDKIERKIEQAAHEIQNKQKKDLEAIRREVKEKARSSEQVKAAEETGETHSSTHQPFVNKELKEMAYLRTLNRVRQQMSVPNRLISRVIHQPVINAVSETVSKIIGRPSGLLGGGLLSLVGTSVYYYVTKHYGYGYNYLIFLLLIASGFILGWLIEAIWFLFGPRKKTL